MYGECMGDCTLAMFAMLIDCCIEAICGDNCACTRNVIPLIFAGDARCMFVMASLSIEVANSVDSLCRKAAVDDGNLVPFAWKCEELYLHVASLLHHLKMCRVW